MAAAAEPSTDADAPARPALRRLVQDGVLMDSLIDDAGRLWFVHSDDVCKGSACVFHNPSAHHMNFWRLIIRDSTLVERICVCGVGHPDPDSLAYFVSQGKDYLAVHGCCGCCLIKGVNYENRK